MKPLKIYVAGPYSSEDPNTRAFNVRTAMMATANIYKLGHYPYCPHLTHFLHRFLIEWEGASLTYEQWMDFDHVWVSACDALLHLGHSNGADRELAQAQLEGKIIYGSVAEIPAAVRL